MVVSCAIPRLLLALAFEVYITFYDSWCEFQHSYPYFTNRIWNVTQDFSSYCFVQYVVLNFGDIIIILLYKHLPRKHSIDTQISYVALILKIKRRTASWSC